LFATYRFAPGCQLAIVEPEEFLEIVSLQGGKLKHFC